jgi:hypothetical protein
LRLLNCAALARSTTLGKAQEPQARCTIYSLRFMNAAPLGAGFSAR